MDELLKRVDALGRYLDVEARRVRLEASELKRRDPAVSDVLDAARETEKEIAAEKDWVDAYDRLVRRRDDIATLAELQDEEDDADLGEEIEKERAALEREIEALELRGMLSGPDDARNAILTINAGAGGTESQDWAEMLLRMYTRYAEQHGYGVALLEHQPGEAAGIKSASLRVEGRFAYGYLKAESGVHRLVRISPFDSSGRRHTSFASVF